MKDGRYKKRFVTTRGVLQWNPETLRYDVVEKEGYWYQGPWALAHTNANFVQQNWRFRNDDGTQATATWAADEDTAANSDQFSVGDKIRLRFNLGDTNAGTDSNNVGTPTLQYNRAGAGWNNMPTTAGADGIAFASSGTVSDADNDTTQRLTNISGSATYQSSWQEFDDNGSTTSRTYTDDSTEFEFCFSVESGNDGVTYELRILDPTGSVPDSPPSTDASVTITAENFTIPVNTSTNGTLTGQVPVWNHTLPGTTGTLAFGGDAPDPDEDHLATPGAGTLTATGQIPTRAHGLLFRGHVPTLSEDAVGSNHTRNPGISTNGVVSGQAPTLSENHLATPSISTDGVFAGQIPTLSEDHLATPGISTGGVFAGQQPSFDWGVSGQAGSVSLSGSLPTRAAGLIFRGKAPILSEEAVGTTRSPNAGSLSVSGSIPVLSENHLSTPAKSGDGVFSGQAPTLDIAIPVAISTDGAFAGQVPTLSEDHLATPNVSAGGVFAGQIPTVTQTLSVSVDISTGGNFTGQIPVVSEDHLATPGSGTLVFAGQIPIASSEDVALPNVGAITATGSVPVLSEDHLLTPSAGSATFAGKIPVLAEGGAANHTRDPNAGGLTASGSAPSVIAAYAASPLVGSVALSGSTTTRAHGLLFIGHAPALSEEVGSPIELPDAGVITSSGSAPDVVLSSPVIVPSIATISALGSSPVVGDNSLPTAGTALFGGKIPALAITSVASPSVGGLTLTGLFAAWYQTIGSPDSILTIAGNAPTLDYSDPYLVPVGGGVTTNQGKVPVIAFGLPASAGSHSFTGSAPALLEDHVVTPSAGAVSLDASAPLVTQTLVIPVNISTDGTFTGSQPTLSETALRLVPVSTDGAFTGSQPSLSEDHVVTPDVGAAAFSGHAPTILAKRKGGRSGGQRGYSIEIDGEFFAFRTIAELEFFMAQIRESAEAAAENDVRLEGETLIAPKAPRVRVRTASGNASTSKTVQAEVQRTQKAVTSAYEQVRRRLEKDLAITREISQLLRDKIQQEEDEDAILALLL